MSSSSSSLKRKAGAQAGSADAKKPKQTNGNIMSFFGAPKPGPPKSSPPASIRNGGATTARSQSQGQSATPETVTKKFDKEKWVATLTPEQRELLQLEIDTLDESWLAHLKGEIVTKEFLDLKRFLKKEWETKTVFPPKEDVYSWSRHTPLPSVRILILGQDPYHNHNQAHGLSFSVRPPTPAPPSLRNIFIALAKDYPSFRPPPNRGGLLTPWADRGVLLLNTVLTVRAHEANSHANRGWERFTQRVIDLVSERQKRGVVFMAWGSPAGKRMSKVDEKRHLVLRAVHPSPLSAHRGFFEAGHFRKANDWLAERYGREGRVDWGAVVEGGSVFGDDDDDDEEKKKKVNETEEKKKEEDDDEFEGGEIFDEEEGLKEVEAVVEKAETKTEEGKEEDGDENAVPVPKQEADEKGDKDMTDA
ncbi:putative uracil DNA N-glycosylase [Pseudoneurospora amorphoporcata]|uniref:Uracil-DNA glycosylase n=1 Tax=Pseudoneurospora amorphoporcata TaxID=241081 RepID=A0AAN6SDU6_9PEZI|nr:putative uracil DNA N-glycosylase [Pseudoneurospora amorphoporcata]